MSSTKKNSQKIEMGNAEPLASNEIKFNTNSPTVLQDSILDSVIGIDQEKVDQLHKEISAKKEEIKTKLYAISCNQDLFSEYEKFMQEKAEWNSTEALGVVEVNKQIKKIRKEGIKDNTIYMSALPLEASHYFLSKSKGVGLKSAEDFLRLFKEFDQALSDAKEDAALVKDLEKQLAAAMQGVTLG